MTALSQNGLRTSNEYLLGSDRSPFTCKPTLLLRRNRVFDDPSGKPQESKKASACTMAPPRLSPRAPPPPAPPATLPRPPPSRLPLSRWGQFHTKDPPGLSSFDMTACVPAFPGTATASFLRSCVPAFLRSCVPAFLRSCVPAPWCLRLLVSAAMRHSAPSSLFTTACCAQAWI